MKTLVWSCTLCALCALITGCSLEQYASVPAIVHGPGLSDPASAPTPPTCKIIPMTGPGYQGPQNTALFSGGELTVDWAAGRAVVGGGLLTDEIHSAPVVAQDPGLTRMIVASGESDLASGVPAAEAVAKYDALLQTLRATPTPGLQIVLLTLPHLYGSFAAYNDQVDLFNAHVCSLATAGSVWVVNLTPELASQSQFTAASGYLAPTDAGNQVLDRDYGALNR